MEGGYDPDSRRCFDWDKKNWDLEFWAEVKELLSYKKKKILQQGEVRIYAVDQVLHVERRLGEKKLILRTNMTEEKRLGIEPGDYEIYEGEGLQ